MTLPIEICTGNCSDIPEVVIYVSIAFKFTGYLATVMTLLHTKFYEDRPLTFFSYWQF